MLVIVRAIIRFTAVGSRLEFRSQGSGPFFPGEVSLLGKLHGEGKCLSLPGLRKHWSIRIAR